MTRQQQSFQARNADITHRYLHGETLRQIGDSYSITRERVRQILKAQGVDCSQGYAIRKTIKRADLAFHRESVRKYLKKHSLPQTARYFDTTVPEIQALFTPDEIRQCARYRILHHNHNKKTYTDERMRKALLAAKQDRDYLGADFYDRWRKQQRKKYPTALTISKRFGSWRAALAEIGVEGKDPVKGMGEQQFSRQDLIDALRRVQGIVGHPPTLTEYEQQRQKSEPTGHTLKNRFGTWARALRQL